MTASRSHLPPLAMTLGDPDGIGPEIALKAWRARRDQGPAFALVGDPARMRAAALVLDLPKPEPVSDPGDVAGVFADALPVIGLDADDTAPGAAVRSIESAVALALAGKVGAVITNPISKARLYREGFTFPGHTEFIAHLCRDTAMKGERGPIMMLSGGGLRTALVTIHVSLRDAIAGLGKDAIIKTAIIVAESLTRDFAIAAPRLVVAGLNPHAGEHGALGTEDLEIVAPAVEALKAKGLDVRGPMPPDTLFHAEARATYDAAICLYHDQGLIPVKTLDFHGGVNVTLGLPVIRTSPDHGTAFDIAGQGIARADSLLAALDLAADLAANRARHDTQER